MKSAAVKHWDARVKENTVKVLFAGMMCISLFCRAESWKFVEEKQGAKIYIDTDATLAAVGSMTVVKIMNKTVMPDGDYVVDDKYYKHDESGWSECLKEFVVYGKNGDTIMRNSVEDRKLRWSKDNRPYQDFFKNIILLASPLLKLPIEAPSEEALPPATTLSPAATHPE